MPRVRTHYDNLKVARDAPPEVIGAAFLALSGKYGPEAKHQDMYGDEIYLIIRRSYRVLSDPAKRAAHDRWVAEMESGQEPAAGPEAASVPPVGAPRVPASYAADGGPRYSAIAVEMRPDVGTRFVIGAIVIVFVFIAVMAVSLDRSPSTAPAAVSSSPVEQGPAQQTPGQPARVHATAVAEQPQIATVSKSVPIYERPDFAPNGLPWPTESGYVGENGIDSNGPSEVSIDNTGNNADVLVKLFDRDRQKPVAVRVLFLRAHDSFTATGLIASHYDVRCRDLSSGALSRSDPITVRDYDHHTVTLYLVRDGNLRFTKIGPEDFN